MWILVASWLVCGRKIGFDYCMQFLWLHNAHMHTWRARMYTHALLYSGVVGTTPWIVHHTCARLALQIETASQGTQRKLWSGKPKRCKRLLPGQALMRRAMDRSLEDRLQLRLGQTRALQASGLAGKIWPIGILAWEYNPLRNHSVPLHGLNYSLSEEESVIGNDHIWSLSEEESISAGASEDADEDVRISWAHRVKGLRHTCDLVHISTFLASFHFSRASRCHVSTYSKAIILMALMFSCQTVKFTKQFVCMYIPVDSGWQKNWWSGAVDPRSVQA